VATKTITIDVEAYERLRKHRRANESFTELIKRLVPEPIDLEVWFRAIEEMPLSRKAVQAIEDRLADRGRSSSRPSGAP
jgi:predicted CopG family antitoxin